MGMMKKLYTIDMGNIEKIVLNTIIEEITIDMIINITMVRDFLDLYEIDEIIYNALCDNFVPALNNFENDADYIDYMCDIYTDLKEDNYFLTECEQAIREKF